MKEFKRYYIIHASPDEVYTALTNPFTIQLWTGEPAEMTAEAGSEFSMWNGSITGRILELEAGRMVRQEWYFGDQEEQSVVTIKLHPHKKGTSVELHHSNIPDEHFEEFTDGWNNSYFGSLEDFFTQ